VKPSCGLPENLQLASPEYKGRDNMKDVRLLYSSLIADDFDTSELEDILLTARKRNIREGISGVLFHTTDCFIQCLEGSRIAVNKLYNDMMHDTRHHSLMLMSYREIDERMFKGWEMAYIGPGDIEDEILHKHSIGPGFRPETVNESMANAMLTLLAMHLNPKDTERPIR
jgi:hypothetical protein